MTNDLRAAAESLLRDIRFRKDCTGPAHIYNAHGFCQWCGTERRGIAIQAVARAYLAAAPADDGEAWEPEWLATVGARFLSGNDRCWPYWEWVIGSEERLHYVPERREWTVFDEYDEVSVIIPPQPTRGHVRRLLAALGIPCPPKSATPEGRA